MSDLPSIAILQQAHAVPRAGEELEVFGKHAAMQFLNGKQPTLTDAVVHTVKQAGLSPEQVRRVVEFANSSAFLTEFNKEGGVSKYIDFHGGPASPAEVLRDLNDGGGGTVFDRGALDYAMMPKAASVATAEPVEEVEKVASASEEPEESMIDKLAKYGPFGPTGADIMNDMMADGSRGRYIPAYSGGGFDPFGEGQKKMQVKMLSALTGRQPVVVKHGSVDLNPGERLLNEAFAAGNREYPYADPMQDAFELKDKLAGAYDNLHHSLCQTESTEVEVLEDLYQEVKQAALEGTSLGQILAAWHTHDIQPVVVKVAFANIGERLTKDGVFDSLDSVAASLQKTAHVGLVNTEHPLLSLISEYQEVLPKLAQLRLARDEIGQHLEAIDSYIKTAAPLIPKILEAARSGGQATSGVVRGGMGLLTDNAGAIESVANAAGKAVQYAPHAAAVLAGKEVLDRARYSPAVQYGLSHVPGTQASQMRKARLMSGGMYY